MEVYLARIDTKYVTYGVGMTEDEARHEACKEYRRTKNSGYGFDFGQEFGHGRIYTDVQIEDYFGINVIGPVNVPGGVTE